ncbi:hypothetical protein AB0B45_18220 [Nonomuraea sp. NPDC049152]|uniref:hypothetical protein n=1 Tax=Nonomuraea sp. NPDC049152 TaxID=3154350 RepID=UPI0033C77949
MIIYHDPLASDTNSAAGTADDPNIRDARYSTDALPGQSASFRIDAPSGEWAATPKPLMPDPAITYTVYGATSDSTSSTSHVSFQADDASELKPGEVLVQRYDESRQVTVDAVVPLQEFLHEAQDRENCQ